jgi:hypothetical protein
VMVVAMEAIQRPAVSPGWELGCQTLRVLRRGGGEGRRRRPWNAPSRRRVGAAMVVVGNGGAWKSGRGEVLVGILAWTVMVTWTTVGADQLSPILMDSDFLDGDPWGKFGSFSHGTRSRVENVVDIVLALLSEHYWNVIHRLVIITSIILGRQRTRATREHWALLGHDSTLVRDDHNSQASSLDVSYHLRFHVFFEPLLCLHLKGWGLK